MLIVPFPTEDKSQIFESVSRFSVQCKRDFTFIYTDIVQVNLCNATIPEKEACHNSRLKYVVMNNGLYSEVNFAHFGH